MPLAELGWSVTDIGTTHGVILVERMRTLGGQLFRAEDHLQRLADAMVQVGIAGGWSYASLDTICHELLVRNSDLIENEKDCSVVILVSPGDPGIERRSDSGNVQLTPSCIVHLAPIPWMQLNGWYQTGISLSIAAVRNVSPESIPPSIKNRSRLHYYLATQQVNQQSSSNVAVLLSIRGIVTETPVANLLMATDERLLFSPRREDILPGVSLRVVEELAADCGIEIRYEDIWPQQLLDASEILLTGTTGCVWGASSIHGKGSIGGKSRLRGTSGPLLAKLTQAWISRFGLNFVRQASELANLS